MRSKAGFSSVDKCSQEEQNDKSQGNKQSAKSTLFSLYASALSHASVNQLSLSSSHQSPPWIRRLCGRWLLAQRLRCGISANFVAEHARVDATTLEFIELGLAYDIGADDERLDALALLVANTAQLDADMVRHVVHVAAGVAQLSPALLEQVAAEVRPLHPPCDE